MSKLSAPEVARNIVNQLFDAAKVPVATRQQINDKCDAFVAELVQAAIDSAWLRSLAGIRACPNCCWSAGCEDCHGTGFIVPRESQDALDALTNSAVATAMAEVRPCPVCWRQSTEGNFTELMFCHDCPCCKGRGVIIPPDAQAKLDTLVDQARIEERTACLAIAKRFSGVEAYGIAAQRIAREIEARGGKT